MDQVFIDTDVIIDLLIDREPFAGDAARIFTYAERGLITCYVSALSFSNIFYVVGKLAGKDEARRLIEQLEKLVEILPVDAKIIRRALSSDMEDFEDAIQNYCAGEAQLTLLISRNVKDFRKSKLAVHTPDSYLKLLEAQLG